MPVDAKGGWRADVVEAVKAMRPGSSALAAARSTTPTWANSNGGTRSATRTTAARSGPGAAFSRPGPGLEEFVQFCRMVDAEPLICVRFSRRDPKDAAELVQYLNGGGRHGRWVACERKTAILSRTMSILAGRQRAPRARLRSASGGLLPGHEESRSDRSS